MRALSVILRQRFLAAVLPCGALYGLSVALFSSAVFVACLRGASAPVPYGALGAWNVLGLFAGAIFAWRRVPSRAACSAWADDAMHAGGLVLVSELPGASLWTCPEARDLPWPDCRWRRPFAAFGAALALFGVAWIVPFAQAVPENAPVVPRQLMDAITAEIEQLAEESELPAAELDEVRAEMRRIVGEAPSRRAVETVDALDRLADRLRVACTHAGEDLRLASEPGAAGLSAAEAAALRAELAETLAQAPASDDVTEGGAVPGEDGAETGDGAGSGGVSQGAAPAVMSWTDPVRQGESALKDIARAADFPRDASTRVGEAADTWTDFTPTRTHGRVTSLAPLAATGAGVAATPVLPRHRAAVRRYFSPERSEP